MTGQQMDRVNTNTVPQRLPRNATQGISPIQARESNGSKTTRRVTRSLFRHSLPSRLVESFPQIATTGPRHQEDTSNESSLGGNSSIIRIGG